jgi:signal peptidase I
MTRGLCIRAKTFGASMYPIIKTGYKILVEPKPVAELNIGDIVLCQRGEAFIAHRLIKKSGSPFVLTRGDNLCHFDQPVPNECVLGKVIQIENQRRKLVLSGWPNRAYACSIAIFARVRFRGQVRLTRIMGWLYWLIRGQKIT